MGIPDFYREIVVPIFANGDATQLEAKYVEGGADNLWIDANQIIHEVIAVTYGYSKFMTEFERRTVLSQTPAERAKNLRGNIVTEFRRISHFFSRDKELKAMIVGFDGAVPAAKIGQQEERRFRSAVLRGEMLFDTTSISAGTPLMEQIHEILYDEFNNRPQYYARKVIYISHRNVGEGEHTILEIMRETRPDAKLYVAPGRDVLVGADADWLVLGRLTPRNDIWLARNTKFRKFIVMSRFRAAVQEKGLSATEMTLLSFLLGNDFIPKSPSMLNMTKGFATAIKVYQENKIQAVSDDRVGEINWPELHRFFKLLSAFEPELMQDEVALRRDVVLETSATSSGVGGVGTSSGVGGETKQQTESLAQQQETVAKTMAQDPIITRFTTQRSAWYIRNWKLRGDMKLVGRLSKDGRIKQAIIDYIKPTEQRIQNMVREFYTIMGWIYTYYLRGTPNVRFDVYYPFKFAPLLYDLAAYPHAPATSDYARPFPYAIEAWCIEHLVPTLYPPEVRSVAEWIDRNKETYAKGWLDPTGSVIGTNLVSRIFTKRLLCQLALVIPLSSSNVLSDKQRMIVMNEALADIHPTAFFIEIPNKGGEYEGESKATGANELVSLPKESLRLHASARTERIVYLPTLEYNRVLGYMIDNQKATDSMLKPDEPLVRETGAGVSMMSRQGLMQSVMSTSPRVTPSVGGRGRGRGGERKQ